MTTPTSPPSSAPQAHPSLRKRLHQGEALVVALIVLAGVGIGVTTFSPARGFHYWLAMVPLFGGVSAYLAFERARAKGVSPAPALRGQLFHWIALLGAFQLVFLLKNAGQLEYDALGLVALTVLALTTFLAGVHTDWRLCLVGLLLAAVAAAGAYVQQFAWAVVIPALLLLGVLGFVWIRRGRPPTPIGEIS